MSTNNQIWKYQPTINTDYTLTTNKVGVWSDLGITSNSNMTISFTINIKRTSGNWRNIIHVTNSNNDCCNVGDRVPAIWIWCCNSPTLLIVNSIASNGNDYVQTANIPLVYLQSGTLPSLHSFNKWLVYLLLLLYSF